MSTRKLVIVGSGPAGYTAGMYAARAELKPLLFEGEKSGGQLMLTTEVENYSGFPDGIMGPELMMKMREQAVRFGAEIESKFITKVDFSAKPFRLWAGEEEIKAEAVILSTGAEALMLGIPGEYKYLGRGVSTCAVCDAAFFRDKTVFVVGGGDAAMEDTLALVKFAKKVTLVHRRDVLRASKIMQQRVLKDNKDKVQVRWNAEVIEIIGDERTITEIKIRDTKTGEVMREKAEGFFIAIGHKPMTDFLKGQVELDERGYVATRLGLSEQGLKMAGENLGVKGGLVKFPTMTSVEGVFAAGDNVDFRYRQAITAAGLGCMAALDAEWWLMRENND